jgi:hypothetical protein
VKVCSQCSESYEMGADRSGQCKRCKSIYNRKHYLENKSLYVARASTAKSRTRRANTERLREYLGENPCVDCGESDPVVLEFDHIEDKDREIANLLGLSWARVVREIAKCQVRCANCHRRVTARRGGWLRYRLSG